MIVNPHLVVSMWTTLSDAIINFKLNTVGNKVTHNEQSLNIYVLATHKAV